MLCKEAHFLISICSLLNRTIFFLFFHTKSRSPMRLQKDYLQRSIAITKGSLNLPRLRRNHYALQSRRYLMTTDTVIPLIPWKINKNHSSRHSKLLNIAKVRLLLVTQNFHIMRLCNN